MKQQQTPNDPRGPITVERAYGGFRVPKIPEGMTAELGWPEDGDWFLNYNGRLVQKRPQDVIHGARLCVKRKETEDGKVDVQGESGAKP